MHSQPKYYIVEASVLPEVFLRVDTANRMLLSGDVRTVGEAIKAAGISRSAYYKYNRMVRPFLDSSIEKVINFFALLRDDPGILSGVLTLFADSGANILTINQNIPQNGQANVTISARTDRMTGTVDELVRILETRPGVLSFGIQGGGH